MYSKESSPEIWNSAFRNLNPDGNYNRAIVRTIMDHFESVRGKKVLEVGPGQGLESEYLSRMGARTYLIDFAKVPLEIARRRAKSYLTQADSRAIPFPDGTFDVVFSQGLIEHYEPPHALIKEQVRVIKKGGILLVDVPQLTSPQALTKAVLMRAGKWPFGWERNYTISQLESVLKQHGLEIIDSYAWGFKPALNLGLTTKVKDALNGQNQHKTHQYLGRLWDNFLEAEKSSHRSWLAKHALNCVGVVCRKI